jgi:non-canonical purine NTP pyrophosphatase (RdgB/HAM1 family)
LREWSWRHVCREQKRSRSATSSRGPSTATLATEPRGTSGFGYDSIFIPDSDTSQRTYAQMTSEEKNKISHRRRAVEEMRSALGLA